MENTLRVRCPACRKTFHAPRDLVGALGRCGGCRHDFILEGEDPPAPLYVGRARREDSRSFIVIALLVLAWVLFQSLRLLGHF